MTPEELAGLAHLRRARDLIDVHSGARDCAFRDPSGNLVRIAQA